MGKDKRDKLILALVLVIATLLIVLIFIFVITPAINGMIIKGQNDGYTYALLTIMQKAAACEQIPLTLENQTINLIAIECLQVSN
ncbi:MAG: hypothetical protein M1416_01965 [Candidatus Pacearchaeota archaeon]|nr:hypothetical protein [Candidatus Pacearchaeota archaeon]